MLLFFPGVLLQQRLFHPCAPVAPAGSVTSASLAQAEEDPEVHVAQSDLQRVIQRPEESKATQQQQELEEKAQQKLPSILQRYTTRWKHLSQASGYNKTKVYRLNKATHYCSDSVETTGGVGCGEHRL